MLKRQKTFGQIKKKPKLALQYFFNTQNDASHEKKQYVQDPVHVCPQYANTDDSPGSSKNNFALRPQFA
jgi:hypothetical protein